LEKLSNNSFLFPSVKNGGFLDYWRYKQIKKLTIKSDRKISDLKAEADHQYQRLSFDQFQSTFYMFSIGIFSSLLIMLIEFIRKKNNI